MVEERWHDFAKEKPSEDMEGRNFIVSNGHYEKIATWCGYWENEPFMGDRLCDEVVRWKFYFTPEEEKVNDSNRTEPKAMKCDELKAETIVPQGTTITLQMYPKSEVDKTIAEKDAQILDLIEQVQKERSAKVDYKISANDLSDGLKKAYEEIESLKASHYVEMVDAGMRERRLRRALYKACANWAKAYRYPSFRKMERKCRAKAEEFGG